MAKEQIDAAVARLRAAPSLAPEIDELLTEIERLTKVEEAARDLYAYLVQLAGAPHPEGDDAIAALGAALGKAPATRKNAPPFWMTKGEMP